MSASPRAFSDYEAALKMAYEEEVSGEAFFEALAGLHEGTLHQALTLMAQMERVTARVLSPLIAKRLSEACDIAALRRAGMQDAEALRATSAQDLLVHMRDDYPAYVTEFEWVVQMAPHEDRPLAQVLVEHEVAIIEFARAELAGDAHSLGFLKQFLTGWGDV